MNTKIKWLIVFSILGCLYLYTMSLHKKNVKAYYDVFNSSKLNGIITSFSSTKGGETVKLNNSENYYAFITIRGKMNDYRDFAALVSEGDSLLKLPFSDTLYLKKKDASKIYGFTFYKF